MRRTSIRAASAASPVACAHASAHLSSQIRAALKAVGLSVSDGVVDYMLRKYDDNRGATLDLDEFAALVEDVKHVASSNQLQLRLNQRDFRRRRPLAHKAQHRTAEPGTEVSAPWYNQRLPGGCWCRTAVSFS